MTSKILIGLLPFLCAFAGSNPIEISANSSRGILTYQEGLNKTEIHIGDKNTVYGLTFQGGDFPDYYKMNLSQYTVIQITLSHSSNTFFDAVLIGEGIPRKTTRFPVFLLTRENSHFKKNMALLLYSPPKMPQDKSPAPLLFSIRFSKSLWRGKYQIHYY